MENTKENLENAQLLMSIIDTLRREQQQNEFKTGQILDEKKLLANVHKFYVDQGIPVDDSLFPEAIRLMKERQFEYRAPQKSWALSLANLYITRKNWVPVASKISGASLVAILAAWSGMAGWNHYQYQSWEKSAIASTQSVEQVSRNVSSSEKNLNGLRLATPAHPMLNTADAYLQKARAGLTTIPAVPTSSKDRKALYEANEDKAETLISNRINGIALAAADVEKANGQLKNIKNYQTSLASKSVFDVNIPEYLNTYREAQKSAFDLAAQKMDTAAMNTITGTYRGIVEQAKTRDRMEGLVASYAPEAVAPIAALLEQSKGALVIGGLVAAGQFNEQASSAIDALAQSYQLRVVSRPGELSVFWRYYDNQKDTKLYYALVEAVDNSGNKVPLNVFDSEIQRTVKTATFGVRIPESVYQSIYDDKKADGIVDNADFGYKKVGESAAHYNFETLNAFVTNW